MPSTHLALLRGVNNPGKSTRVSMADLRTFFQSLGFRDVRTLLNSGNVLFSPPKRPPRNLCVHIQKALAANLNLACPVIILSRDELIAAVHDNPLANVATNPSWLLVVTPKEPSDLAKLRPLLKQKWTPESLSLGRRAAYLWCATGIADSLLWPAVERTLNRSCTARNISTMTKLLALLEGASVP